MPLSDKTRKILWGRSLNQCAICKTVLVKEKDTNNIQLLIGEECHIISKKTNGPRHKKITNFNYDDADNLILLCCNHHKEVDENILKYTEAVLKEIKQSHENSISNDSKASEHKLSLVDLVVTTHQTQNKFKESTSKFHSISGIMQAQSFVLEMKLKLLQTINAIKEKDPNIYILFYDSSPYSFNLRFNQYTFELRFYQCYSNSATDSHIIVGFTQGFYEENDSIFKHHTVQSDTFYFDVNPDGEFCWRNKQKTLISNDKVIEDWLQRFFKYTYKNPLRRGF